MSRSVHHNVIHPTGSHRPMEIQAMHTCTIDDLCKSDEAFDDVDLYIDLLHRAIILDYLMQIQCMRFEDAAIMI